MACDYDAMADAELARWQGVTHERGMTAKHHYLAVTYRGQTRRIVYPASGSDRRGPQNHAQDVRQVLRELGAVRITPAHKPRRTRHRCKPADVPLPLPVAADQRQGMADALRALLK